MKPFFNENIAFYAFRYALGRMTYVASDVVDYLINNWEKLSLNSQEDIQREIREYEEKHGNLGMEMDKKQWERILALPVKK